MKKITKHIPKSIKNHIKQEKIKNMTVIPENADRSKKDVTNTISGKICTGCGACMNSCGFDAIRMEPDNNGFLHPSVDADKCTNCGVCSKVCPVLHPKYTNDKKPECRAIYAEDRIRMTAASGGIFTAFAEKLLERGGYICGSVFKEDFSAKHVLSDDTKMLDRIKGSKYVQSDTARTFSEVKNVLKDGKEVLYCGTPCQIAGLYSFLGKTNTDNLYTMDLVCHGVPSHKVLRKYLDDCYPDIDIKDINFRDKEKYGWSSSITITQENGEIIRCDHNNDPFYKAFLPCMALREACASCKFSVLPRQGDITIGDFWGIDRYDKKLNDRKGTSVVLVNNKKGEQILEQCKDVFSVDETVPIEYALHVNKTIEHPYHPHPNRGCFFDMLNYTSFRKCVDTCLKRHYDVGIVGLWYGLNYGSILTYYALYTAIESLGKSCVLLKKPSHLWTDRYSDADTIANRFIRSRCLVSHDMNNIDDIYRMNDFCDSFVVGSDVVWNYEICGSEAGNYFFLDFVDDDKKKISYASSFGTGFNGPPSIKAQAKKCLDRFSSISVREDYAVNILRSQFSKTADKVMDPVFLADSSIYHNMADSVQKCDHDYIAAYILGPDTARKNCLLKISSYLNKEIKIIPNPNDDPDDYNRRMELPTTGIVSVEEWLNYIKNCDLYVGDSFHGVCFAIIFKKPFIALLKRGAPDNCRYETLLGMLGLSDRIHYFDSDVENLETIINTEIDYEKVYRIMDPEVQRSRRWLNNALTGSNNGYIYGQISELLKADESINRKLDIIMKYCSLEINLITVLNDYLDYLINNKDKFTVFLVAMDTPGMALSEQISDKIKMLGANISLRDKHWYGYAAVLSDGSAVFEKEAYNQSVHGEATVDGLNCKLFSAPYQAGNKGSVIINGKEYCVNSRGLNFVVYNRERQMVCDSACFDTHFPDYRCTR